MMTISKFMKKVLAPGFLFLALNLMAQEQAKVISATPVYQMVNMTQQVCTNTPIAVNQPKSGAGALMGAIAGGAIGNSMGHGSGNAAATAIGVMGGAILGDHIEGQPSVIQNVQTCNPITSQQNKLAYYDIKYEFGGKQYSVQMPQDPGPSIQLSVSPVGAQGQAYQGDGASSAPVYQQAPVIVQTQPVYQPYYARPYYPPVGVNLDFGYWGGGRHWR